MFSKLVISLIYPNQDVVLFCAGK